MGYSFIQLTDAKEKVWRSIKSDNKTLFHELDFLKYHDDRFEANEHNLLVVKGETPVGILPLGIFEENGQRIAKSPYGASYGGPVFQFRTNYSDLNKISVEFSNYLKIHDIDKCYMILPLNICNSLPDETFKFTLMEQGFKCINRDISHVVNIQSGIDINAQLNMRVRNKIKKAAKVNFELQKMCDVTDFYLVLEKTHEKLGTKPTHTLAELRWLNEKMPQRIYFHMAYIESKPVAGICFFVVNKLVNSSFYLSQDPEHQNLQLLTFLIADALRECQETGYKWFDFGTSSANQIARSNLFSFKENFGAIGMFRETYLWEAK